MVAITNKTRIRDSKIVVTVSILLTIFTRQDDLPEVVELIGCVLVFICALGRIYCSAYLGGVKSHKVVDYGPFSVCRNPLYVFTFIGVIGISLITSQIIVMVLMPVSFFIMYFALIKREEVYLEGKFGQEYLDYKVKTPRLIPDFKLYHAPPTINMVTKSFYGSLKDSAMWVLAYPVLEFIEYLQDENIIRPLHIHLIH